MIMIDTQAEYDITEAMIMFGGGFVRKLGELFRAGDHVNKAKLLAAFPEYFAEYRDLAALTQNSQP